MDGEVRLGYQLAEICLQTHLFGRQWLSAQHHPGDTVSATCLGGLIQEAERRLGCHPRRRTELILKRLEACEQSLTQALALTTQENAHATAKAERVMRLVEQIRQAEVQIEALGTAPISSRRTGPYSKLTRLQSQIEGWRKQLVRAQAQLAQCPEAQSP
jgi:hypothetical protein